MKISNITFRNAASSIVLAFILVFTSATASATDKIKAPSVEVKYIGSIDNSPLFQVDFENETGEDVYVTLKDEVGNVLYTEVSKEKKFSKKFRLEGADLYNAKLVLNIRSKKETQAHVFQINKSVRQVEEVTVNKL